jgi:hypothetical protein
MTGFQRFPHFRGLRVVSEAELVANFFYGAATMLQLMTMPMLLECFVNHQRNYGVC